MAVVYFTSNASTGAGSLVEAINNASPGDVIRPDETVFERGSTIEIVLASTLNVDKSLTLDGGPYRVRLNGDGLARCCNVASGVNVEITAFDIVGGGWNSQTGLDQGSANGAGVSVAGDSSIVLKRCGFFGCRGSFGGGLAIAANATAELNDCVIVGCYARGMGAGIRSLGDVAVYGSTIIGNVANTSTAAHDMLVDQSSAGRVTLVNSIVGRHHGNVEIGAGCVVGVASSQIGFVASPPDDFSVDNWTVNAWQNWDLRLLDDASPNPSPYRDAGDVDAASKYDFDGNFRGRETNGVATCSPGAYETIQADLFCIASEFLPGAPTDLSVEWRDKTSTTVGVQIRWSNNLQSATSFQYQKTLANSEEWGKLDTLSASSVGLTYNNVALGTAYGFRIRACIHDAYTDWSTVFFIAGERVVSTTCPENVTFGSPYGWAASRFADVSGDVAPQDGQTLFIERVVAFGDAPPDASTLNVGGRSKVSTGNGAGDSTISLGVSATFDVTSSVSAARLADESLVKLRAGSLTVDGRTSTPDAFEPLRFVRWTGGRLRVVGDLHLLEALDIPAGATLDLDGAALRVATLAVVDGANVEFSGVDAVLTATESATVGAATFAGAGYFATPPGTDASAATFAEEVRRVDFGANVETFAATATGPTTARLEWSASNETVRVCVERKTSSGWEVVDVRGESGLTAAIATPGATVFRAFDGAAFWSDSAWFLTGEQFTVETDFFAVAEDGAESVEYETETHIVTTNIDKSICWGQSLTFLARIRNAFTGDLLLNDGTRTKGVRYSLYRREGSLFSTSEDDVPVRLDVDAGAACLLETAQTSDAWPGVEYNFALIPANSADDPLIPAPGNYVLRVFVELTTGNPIVFVYTFAAR